MDRRLEAVSLRSVLERVCGVLQLSLWLVVLRESGEIPVEVPAALRAVVDHLADGTGDKQRTERLGRRSYAVFVGASGIHGILYINNA